MRHPVAAALRLIGWGWILIRHDALMPREITPLLPPWLRPLAGLLHLFSGKEARTGRPGERVGRALEQLGHQVEREGRNAEFGFGGAQLIRRIDGGYIAGSDHRKDGCAVGF